MNNVPYYVDQSFGEHAGRLFQIYGWFMHDALDPARFQVRINGRAELGCLRIYRHDVAEAYRDNPQAVKSGFIGDVFIPSKYKDGDSVDISIVAVLRAGEIALEHRRVRLVESLSPQIKVRHMDLTKILDYTGKRNENVRHQTIAGIPHFHAESDLPIVRLSQEGSTHEYGTLARSLIEESKGYVLDFGAGIQTPERLRDHVVNLDAIQFPYIDVVNSCQRLPFKDSVFQTVVSQAVFEHIADPFHAAREIFRVLKPGGTTLIDTAFMQPFHGDPSHYFNMTKEGLRQIMHNFEIIELGVQPYQLPSYGLVMQLEAILPFISSNQWRPELNRLIALLRTSGPGLDSELGAVGQEVLAAGVYVLARKPPEKRRILI